MIFDTHAHYADEAFEPDREALIAELQPAGISAITEICAEYADLEKVKALTAIYPFFYGAFGIHPDSVGELNEDRLQELERFCRLEKAVAVGEIGLDYHWMVESKEVQIEWFERQAALAGRLGLPVVIHSRDAAADMLEAAKRINLRDIGGVMHCYSYSKEMAKAYLDMGLFLGIGGVLTFKNAKKLKETVAYAPIEQLVLETDCPYLSPEPNRGKRNSSLNLPYVLQEVARIKQMTLEETERCLWENAIRLYRLDASTLRKL